MPSRAKLKRNNRLNSGRNNRPSMRHSSKLRDRHSCRHKKMQNSRFNRKTLGALISPEWRLRMPTLI